MQTIEEHSRASAADISRLAFHGGRTRWEWALAVGSMTIRSSSVETQDFEQSTLRASVDAEGAASMEIVLPANLSGQRGSTVRLYVGYGGKLEEWFTGVLGKVAYDSRSGFSTTSAHGPSWMLGRRYFDKPVRYQGHSLRRFFSDLAARLYSPLVRLEVSGGGEFELEDTVFGGEVSLGEAAQPVLESAEYVMSDRVGGVLAVEPRPRPSTSLPTKAVYDIGDYPEGQPEPELSEEGPYSKVVVFRNDEDGNEVVRAEARIAYRGLVPPAPNEIYWVPDFEGDQVLAQQVARSTAAALQNEPTPGTLRGISANPALHRHDGILMYLYEEEVVFHRRGYASLITEIELDALAATMDLSYSALRISSEEVAEPQRPPQLSPYIVPSERAARDTPFGEDFGGVFVDMLTERPYFGEDLTGLWIDPELVTEEYADEAGLDEGGLWVNISNE